MQRGMLGRLRSGAVVVVNFSGTAICLLLQMMDKADGPGISGLTAMP